MKTLFDSTKLFSALLVGFLNIWLSTSTAHSQSFKQNFIDSVDHSFDISNWMSHVYGFFPIVGVITEPATGYGAAGGLIYLSKKRKLNFAGNVMPPDVSVLGGAITENGTWAAIAAHKAYWKQDRIRFSGVTGYLSPNLAIYRSGPLGNIRKFGFNLKGPLFISSLSFRIKTSNSFLGARYIFMRNVVKFDLPVDNIPINPQDIEMTLSGIGGLYMYDSRDNTFTPNQGVYSNVSFIVFNQALGSSEDYSRLDAYLVGFKTVGKNIVLGGRFDYRAALNDPPFYVLPFAQLRGVPAFRYQGNQLILLETEERWDFSRRWSMTGFAGLAKSFAEFEVFDQEDWIYSLGGGFRYLLARKFNIFSGIDVARGPEEWAFYIQFGHYWNML